MDGFRLRHKDRQLIGRSEGSGCGGGGSHRSKRTHAEFKPNSLGDGRNSGSSWRQGDKMGRLIDSHMKGPPVIERVVIKHVEWAPGLHKIYKGFIFASGIKC